MKDEERESGKAVGSTLATILPAIVENLHGPEVYADCAAFFGSKGGNITITLCSLRYDNATDPQGPARNVVIARLVMPTAGARGLADGIYERLREQGLMPDKSGAN